MKEISKYVMRLAHEYRRQGLDNWSKCLRLAWAKYRVAIKGTTVTIRFWKVSTGELREAVVRRLNHPEGGVIRFIEQCNGYTQWRSFRLDAVE